VQQAPTVFVLSRITPRAVAPAQRTPEADAGRKGN